MAALQVLYGHAIVHLELHRIPVVGDFIAFFSGVPIFFTLSGFLIWQSIGRSKSFWEYSLKRFWRIYPELWVAVAFEIIVLLLLYHQPINWPQMGLFVIGQATVFQFWTPDFLRGYGCGTPNGALWTITVLIQFYFCAYFIFKWLSNKKLYIWGGVIVVSVIIGWLTPYLTSILPKTIGKLYCLTLIPYLWMFLVAAFMAEFKDKVLPLLRQFWWVFVLFVLIKRIWLHLDIAAMYPVLDTVLLFCGIVGFSYMFPKLNIKTDISYGVYIYHMTVVNALIALGFTGGAWELWIVIGVTCLLAWISTVTVGRLSVKKKQKLT